MKAEDFFEKQMANIRELWHLSDLQKKMVYILMEEYEALHIAMYNRSSGLGSNDYRIN